jgi:ABC-type nitrate/sulfonate/bicarbonate transport system permease component
MSIKTEVITLRRKLDWHTHQELLSIAGLIVVNGVWFGLGLWNGWWWGGLILNFTLIVVLTERLGKRIPFRYKRHYDMTLAAGFPVLLLICWQLIVGANILSPRWFPPPTKIGHALWDLTVDYNRFEGTSLIGRPWLIPERFRDNGWDGVWGLYKEGHVWATLTRVILGFVLGSFPGILIGVIMGLNRTIRTMLDTTLSAIYVLPKIAIFPLVMLVFDNPFGEGPKVTVIAISAFFLVAINTMTGVRDIDPVLLQAGKNYGANWLQMFRHIILPGAMPVIFSGLRLALGTALIVVVAIEFVRAKMGVGHLIYYHWQVLEIDKMYAGLLVVMALGILLTYGLQWFERRLMPWR